MSSAHSMNARKRKSLRKRKEERQERQKPGGDGKAAKQNKNLSEELNQGTAQVNETGGRNA